MPRVPKPLLKLSSRPAFAPVLIFVVTFFAFAFFFLHFSALYDGDSYFHLAAARLYAGGIPHELPWARFSLMHQGWGDKELLFHVALLPFAQSMDAAIGGRLALAVLNAALVTLLASLGRRALGPWGLLAPALVYLLPAGFLPRIVRLRPELLALLLLLAAVELAGRRRHLPLAAVAALFSLAYTAAHLLPALSLIWMLWDRSALGRWNFRPAAAALGGSVAGLLVHPQFPKNLEVWWVQNVLFFRMKAGLDVGNEIVPPGIGRLLAENALLAFALLFLWVATRPTAEPPGGERDRLGPYFTLSALTFLALYAAMARMITWLAPFAVLAVAYSIRHRERRLGPSIDLGRWRLPVAPLLALTLAAALPALLDPTLVQLLRTDRQNLFEAEQERLGASLPPGSKVAATWQEAELFAFWSPRAQFLNVLDPIFMALPHPDLYELQRTLFAGSEPDVPLALARLDSDWIEFSRAATPPLLASRLEGDPRLDIVYRGIHLLARRVASGNEKLVLDWTEAPGGRKYPRLESPPLRAAEGFVDLGRLRLSSNCGSLQHGIRLDAARELAFTFAPWGPGTVLVDGRRVAATASPRWGVLARGLAARQPLAAGRHWIEVRTCAAAGRIGFYLRPDP